MRLDYIWVFHSKPLENRLDIQEGIGAASAWRVAGNGGVLRLKHCKYDFYYLCRVNDIAT